ncbi:ABC transporter ATP-binding protein [Meiothermus rufus]|uniref:ABC transporter ATP-binding protein n=1 Tax=Meiothermus rufus TaxID=604332 RepID=UPI0004101795|nr:ABC transporter ATP-binding protein [Meiothermus rufus]
MLRVEELQVRYGGHVAVEKAHLCLAPGEIAVVLGANGAGKSSLLRGLVGLVTVEGRVSVEEEDLTTLLRTGRTEKLIRKGLYLVPERGGVFRSLSVRENLLLAARGSWQKALELFPPLAERLSQQVGTMSGGEQRMVALARALVAQPRYLLLDEPTLGLAPLLARQLLQSLEAIRREGVGILLVEQNAELALRIAQRGYVLERGRMVKEAPADRLLHDPTVRKAYLGA